MQEVSPLKAGSNMCAHAAERVAEIVDRVLSLDYATVRPEVQNAQQSETQQPEAAPHHHPDAAPIPNGLYDQVS